MRVCLFPRADRPYHEKVSALRKVGFDVNVFVRGDRDHSPIVQNMADLIKHSEVLLVEYPVAACQSGAASCAAWPWIRKKFPTKKIILWCEEIRRLGDYPPSFFKAIPVFNEVYLNHADPSGPSDWKEMGVTGEVKTMWGSAEMGIADDAPHPTPEYDVFFVRRHYISRSQAAPGEQAFPLAEKRFQILRAIDEKFKLGVAGEGWAGLKNMVGRIDSRDKVFEFIRRGKVVFGMNQFDLRRYYPERVWQSLASKRAHLTANIPGIEEDFDVGRELVTFDSADDAIEKIGQLLSGDRWKEVGEAGYAVLKERYLWEHNYLPLYRSATVPWKQIGAP